MRRGGSATRPARRWVTAGLSFALVVVALGSGRAGQQGQQAEPDEVSPGVRARLEGTWVLEEWHHEGDVLTPPQVDGRWSNHDGVVMATFHRQSHGTFESFAGYGTYATDADSWSYRYDRIETARGTSPADAEVTVREDTEPRSFTLAREGEVLVLSAEGDRREYDDTFFIYLVDGEVLRKYRKVRD